MTNEELKAEMDGVIEEAERVVVSLCVNFSADAIPAVVDFLQPSDFLSKPLGELYRVAIEMADAKVEVTKRTYQSECVSRGLVERFGEQIICEALIAGEFSGSDAVYYAQRVVDFANQRRLTAAARVILRSEITLEPKPAKLKAEFDAATDILLRSSSSRPVTFGNAVRAVVADQRSKASDGQLGMKTGLPSLDYETGGFHRGSLVLLGGRTFAGKTALGLSLATYFASNNRPVMFVSLEMSHKELAERALADDCGFELRQFTLVGLGNKEVNEIESSLGRYDDWKMTIYEDSRETTASIRAKAKLLKASGGLDLLVIDNLQLVEPSDSSAQRRLQLTRITEDLKRLSRELDCCILLLAQLNADAEGNEPDDTHYSESKQVLAAADVAILAHRENKTDSNFLLKITKNRRGTQARVTLRFDGAYQRFVDATKYKELF